MATAITSERVVNGSYGELWLDGEKMAEVYGLDAQMEVMKAEVPMCGMNDIPGHGISLMMCLSQLAAASPAWP